MDLSLAARLVLHALGELLSPQACAACDATAAHVFCSPCASTVLRAGPPADDEAQACAFAAFGGALAEAIRRFKYAARSDLARPLGHLMRRAARDAKLAADVVAPVPLHPKRLAERGYNQAALLARAAASELRAPMAARALIRSRDTPQQASLDRAERRRNVERAFTVYDERAIRGRRVLLVDDVATTGATLRACSEALIGGGAESVQALVLARTVAGG